MCLKPSYSDNGQVINLQIPIGSSGRGLSLFGIFYFFYICKTKCWHHLVLFWLTVPRQFLCADLCASVVSYVRFVSPLLFPHLSVFWCLGKAVRRGRSISLLLFLIFRVNLNCLGSHFTQNTPNRAMIGPNTNIRSQAPAKWVKQTEGVVL